MPLSEDVKRGIRKQAETIEEGIKKGAVFLHEKLAELAKLQKEVDELSGAYDDQKRSVNELLAVIGDDPHYVLKKKQVSGSSQGGSVKKRCSSCNAVVMVHGRSKTCPECGEKQALVKVEDDEDPDPEPPPRRKQPEIPPRKPVPSGSKTASRPKRLRKPKPRQSPKPYRGGKESTPVADSMSDFTRAGAHKVKKVCTWTGCKKVAYVGDHITMCPHCSKDGLLRA